MWRNYHVVLSSGEERNLRAEGYVINSGVLEFYGLNTESVVSYASGAWQYVETEQKDDKGYPGDDEEATPQG